MVVAEYQHPVDLAIAFPVSLAVPTLWTLCGENANRLSRNHGFSATTLALRQELDLAEGNRENEEDR